MKRKIFIGLATLITLISIIAIASYHRSQERTQKAHIALIGMKILEQATLLGADKPLRFENINQVLSQNQAGSISQTNANEEAFAVIYVINGESYLCLISSLKLKQSSNLLIGKEVGLSRITDAEAAEWKAKATTKYFWMFAN